MTKKTPNRKNKSTSFDLTDIYEVELLKFAEDKKNGKFSKYVKRLIVQDRDRVNRVEVSPLQHVVSIVNETDADKVSMSGFL